MQSYDRPCKKCCHPMYVHVLCGRTVAHFVSALSRLKMPHIISWTYLLRYSAVSDCPLSSVSSVEKFNSLLWAHVQLLLIRPFCSHIMRQITRLSVLFANEFCEHIFSRSGKMVTSLKHPQTDINSKNLQTILLLLLSI